MGRRLPEPRIAGEPVRRSLLSAVPQVLREAVLGGRLGRSIALHLGCHTVVIAEPCERSVAARDLLRSGGVAGGESAIG
jgi:hypothetical protein